MMKKIVVFASGILLSSIHVVAQSPPSRRNQDQAASNDNFFANAIESYSCDGYSFNWIGVDTDISNTTLTKTVIFDYDISIREGSSLTLALASVESKLLRYVADDIFSHCLRKLENIEVEDSNQHRRAHEITIDKITSSPGDTPYNSEVACESKASTSDPTTCFPIAGSITAHYVSTGDKEVDESDLEKRITEAVKRTMDDGVLVTDTTQDISYIGSRVLPSENYLPVVSEPEPEKPKPSSFWAWIKGGGGIIVGTIIGLLGFFSGLVIFRNKSNNSKSEISCPIDSIDVALEEGAARGAANATKPESEQVVSYDNAGVDTGAFCGLGCL